MLKISKILFKTLERASQSSWRRTFERSHTIKGYFNKVSLIVTGCLSREYCISGYLLAKEIVRIGRKSGLLFLALYLKQCNSSLQHAYGGCFVKPEELPIPISLTRKGYPVIIPAFHRLIIYKKDDKSDMIVKLYLSWFSIFNTIIMAKRVSKDTFKSISESVEDKSSIMSVVSELGINFRNLVDRYMPFITEYDVLAGITWVPTWKSLPNSDRDYGRKFSPSSFTSMFYELASFASNVQFIHSKDDLFSPGILWTKGYHYGPFDFKINQMLTWSALEFFEKWTGPVLPTIESLGVPELLIKHGRLAQTIQGGGKRRIFAIGNYIKQSLLRPFHDFFMKLLRRLPNDGTYDQLKPLKYVTGFTDTYSFDLKSATDRWPLELLYAVTKHIFGPNIAASLVQSTLSLNSFLVGHQFVKKQFNICFTTGQPLGYLCSWPLFAISHHLVVWMASERVYPGIKFTRYCILGDDLVIADKYVAAEYKSIVSDLKVSISLQKSLISNSGAFEFAKKYRVKCGSVDCSPISIKSLRMFVTIVGLLAIREKYNIDKFSILARIGGAGYRVLGSITHKRSRKWDRLWVGFNKPKSDSDMSLEWWYGRGLPLNPYLKAHIVLLLLNKFRPKELKLPPDELFIKNEIYIQEFTLIRNWVTIYLKHLLWYTKMIQCNGDYKIDDLFDCPMVETNWKKSNVSKELQRFGYLWKCFDLVSELGLNWMPPILSGNPLMIGWIQGGTQDKEFLMAPVLDNVQVK